VNTTLLTYLHANMFDTDKCCNVTLGKNR